MQRDITPSLILEGQASLYLGNASQGTSPDLLAKLGIFDIISITEKSYESKLNRDQNLVKLIQQTPKSSHH